MPYLYRESQMCTFRGLGGTRVRVTAHRNSLPVPSPGRIDDVESLPVRLDNRLTRYSRAPLTPMQIFMESHDTPLQDSYSQLEYLRVMSRCGIVFPSCGRPLIHTHDPPTLHARQQGREAEEACIVPVIFTVQSCMLLLGT
jgi:hypothetical protein